MNAIRISSPARYIIIGASRNGETVVNNECNGVVDSQVEHAIDCKVSKGLVVRMHIVFSLAVCDNSTPGNHYQSGR